MRRSTARRAAAPRWAKRTTVPAALVAAAFAAPGDAHPTEYLAVDIALRIGAAAVLVLLGSRARRWTWFVLLGGVAVLDARLAVLLAVVLGLGVALHSVLTGERRTSHGSLITLLASVLLYRLPHHHEALLTATVVAATTAPTLVSGYRSLRGHRRRVVGGVLEGAGAILGLVVVLFLVAAAQSRSQVDQGVRDVQAGREAAQRGDQEDVVRRLDAATASFGAAERTLGSWWARPVRFVPVLAPQARALADATRAGTAVTSSAARAAKRTDYRRLRAGPGRIDLARLQSFNQPFADLSARLDRAERSVRAVDRTWLAAPLRSQVDELGQQIDAAQADAAVARRVLRVAPDLLGASGPRRYALWFSTPAEARELGGYLGSFGELTAVDGKVDLARTGRITELLPTTQQELDRRRFPGEEALPPRYRYYDVPQYLGNATGTQDLALAARTYNEVYRRSGGTPVDGVITLDPYALAAILQLTGPVEVEGLAVPLSAENAANFLLREQYAAFGDRSERADFLANALEATFDRLTSQPLPEPRLLAQTLAPLTASNRLMVTSFDADDQRVLTDLHLTGTLPPAGSSDWLSVTNANANPNKIDVFLERTIRDQVQFDPSTGRTISEVTVTLTNTAPAADLAGGVSGNTVGLPPGTNRTFLSVGSPLALTRASVGGIRVPTEPEADATLGVVRNGLFVDIGPRSTLSVVMRFEGTLRPGPRYRLRLVSQPLVNVDRLEATVSGPGRPTDIETHGPFELAVDRARGRLTGTASGGVGTIDMTFADP